MFTRYLILSLTESTIEVANKLISQENLKILKNGLNQKDILGIDVDNLITVIENSNGEIVSVDFKMSECEKIIRTISNSMDLDTNTLENNGYILNITIGYLSNSPIVANLGPEIPVAIKLSDVILASISTKITEFGINNALIELCLKISINYATVLPTYQEVKTEIYEIPIATKIITGKVPNLYSGSYLTESPAFNLSISE